MRETRGERVWHLGAERGHQNNVRVLHAVHWHDRYRQTVRGAHATPNADHRDVDGRRRLCERARQFIGRAQCVHECSKPQVEHAIKNKKM